ncbi:MAG: DUF3566 domain-containing protein [Actinomycetota bacterium]
MSRRAPDPESAATVKRARQTRVVLRKISPWSVFRFSIVFYFCLMIVLLAAGAVLFFLLDLLGILSSVTNLIRDLFADQGFAISGTWIFLRALGLGLVSVVLWSVVNVFGALLYNLIADVVGGLEVWLGDPPSGPRG